MTITTQIHVRRDEPNEEVERAVGGYRVVHMRHGIAAFRPINVGDMGALCKHWQEEYGYDQIGFGIASAIGATLVVTNAEGAKLWHAEVEAEAKTKAAGDAELEWLLGWDTGTSSMTLLLVLGESETARQRAQVKLGREDRRDPPSDPDDLGRCIRLLDRFPAWRDRLATVASCLPAWAPVVVAWPELEALYREEVGESHTGKAPKLYARMQALREGRP